MVSVKDQVLELFKYRFSHNLKKDGTLEPFAEDYFNEWCDRVSSGTAYECADYSTKQVLKYIGVKELSKK